MSQQQPQYNQQTGSQSGAWESLSKSKDRTVNIPTNESMKLNRVAKK